MSTGFTPLTDSLHAYVRHVTLREPAVLRRLRAETAALPEAGMQIAPEQGQAMRWLVETLGVQQALEVGVFTGYSSTAVALGLPPEGHLVACDISERFTAIAQRAWAEAGVADRIELRLGPALDTLDALLAEGHASRFDFAFIDADKGNYAAYFARALRLVRRGGVIAVDNVLWGGRVADPAEDDADTVAIRAFNAALQADPRVAITLLPIGDGLTLARRL